MKFVQFFNLSAIDNTRIIEACGDRSMVILDAREKSSTHEEIAKSECIKRKYVAYQMFKGDSFSRAKSLGPIVKV